MAEQRRFRRIADEQEYARVWDSYTELGPSDLRVISDRLEKLIARFESREDIHERDTDSFANLEANWNGAKTRLYILEEMIIMIAWHGFPLNKFEDGPHWLPHLFRGPVDDRLHKIADALDRYYREHNEYPESNFNGQRMNFYRWGGNLVGCGPSTIISILQKADLYIKDQHGKADHLLEQLDNVRSLADFS